MLIDGFGTFGASNRIDHHLVSHVRHADDVAHQPLNRPEFLLRADSAGKSDHPRTDSDVDVGRVESRLLIEGVANQRAQLIVTQVFDSLDVLVILFHCSSGSALGGSGYRKNSSDAPIVRARLFFQKERAWLPDTAAVPPVGTT